MNRPRRAHVSGFPHRIVRRNSAINMRCLRLQRADVKRQHKFLKLATLCPSEKVAWEPFDQGLQGLQKLRIREEEPGLALGIFVRIGSVNGVTLL